MTLYGQRSVGLFEVIFLAFFQRFASKTSDFKSLDAVDTNIGAGNPLVDPSL